MICISVCNKRCSILELGGLLQTSDVLMQVGNSDGLHISHRCTRYLHGILSTAQHLWNSRPVRTRSVQPFPYNFAPCFFIFSLSLSRIILLKIFPLGLFGTTSINSIPPLNHL